VVIADISEPPEVPQNATFIKTDVTKWASQLNLFQNTVDLCGRIDVVCANAGIGGQYEDFQDRVDADGVPSEPTWATIQVNLIGVCISTKLAIHYFKKFGGGKVILTSSLSGTFLWE
jgi:NAD(P)-dependent dehydrogenase (short-subunit alcohol dehydrogenase family)